MPRGHYSADQIRWIARFSKRIASVTKGDGRNMVAVYEKALSDGPSIVTVNWTGQVVSYEDCTA